MSVYSDFFDECERSLRDYIKWANLHFSPEIAAHLIDVYVRREYGDEIGMESCDE